MGRLLPMALFIALGFLGGFMVATAIARHALYDPYLTVGAHLPSACYAACPAVCLAPGVASRAADRGGFPK